MGKKDENKAVVESKPAEAGPVEPASAEGDLQFRLDSALKGNENLNKKLSESEDKVSSLEGQLSKLQETNKNMHETLKTMEAVNKEQALELESLRAVVDKLQEKLTKVGRPFPEGDCAIVDGEVFKIVHRCEAKWMNKQVTSRNVSEHATALILDREGE